MPAIDVDGVGRIAFPILPAQAERLVAIAEAAPYGRGEETVVDRDVRRTWQVDSAKVRIGGRHWEKTLSELVADVALGLGVSGPVAADFYKLLVYDAGSFFVGHRDTEKVPGMFATMVLVLPSTHSGGELVVKHAGRETTLDLRPEDPSEIGFAGFYADCVHEVRPVTAGFRVCLVYNLRFVDKSRPPKAPDYRAVERRAAEVLRNWANAEDEPDKLILPLEHAYTPAELSFGALKGADAGMASVLVKAAAEADCDLHLALVSIEESGSAEHTAYYGRGRGRRDEDDETFEVAEVFDRALILSEWRRPDGGEAGFDDFPFSEDELCPPDAFDDLAPDEEHFHEATGNEGASFERTYRRAGLVLWPAARRLAVLNQAGLGATLPYLETLTARWEAGGASIASPLWREADELSGLHAALLAAPVLADGRRRQSRRDARFAGPAGESEAHRRVSRGAVRRRPLRRVRQWRDRSGRRPSSACARNGAHGPDCQTQRPGPSQRLRRSAAALRCGADGRPGRSGANRRRLDRRHAWRHDQAGGGRALEAAKAGEARLRRRSSDGCEPDRRGARRACDRAPAGLAEDIRARRRADARRAGARQARRRASPGRRRPGCGRPLSIICAGASRCRWRRRGTGPGPTRSNAHAPTAVRSAPSWCRRINSSGA